MYDLRGRSFTFTEGKHRLMCMYEWSDVFILCSFSVDLGARK